MDFNGPERREIGIYVCISHFEQGPTEAAQNRSDACRTLKRTVRFDLEAGVDYQAGGVVSRKLIQKMIRLPANRPRALDAPERFKMRFVMVRS